MRTAPLVILLLFAPTALALQWSELLPDPAGDDDRKEFVELVGTENLTGCTISDSASTDTLHVIRPGNDAILIVEDDSVHNATPGATIYGIGAAIGNGLGNAADTLRITCDGTELLASSYNTSTITGYSAGMSLEWQDGWVAGTMDGTPGVVPLIENGTNTTQPPDIQGNTTPPAENPSNTSTNTTLPRPRGQRDQCNDTLAMTLGTTQAHVGDIITFTVLSDGYASWEATTRNLLFAYGDTLTQQDHAITVPQAAENATIRIVAARESCAGRQRAVRIITVLPTIVKPATHSTVPAPPEPAPAPDPIPPAAEEPPRPAPSDITGHVIHDEPGSAVPWIAGFGAVTLALSAWLYHTERH